MSELVVNSVDAGAEAGSALSRLREVEKAGQLRLEDPAAIAKDQSSNVRIKSALFLIVRDWNPAAIAAAVSGQRGEILHTTLSPYLVESLEQALKRPN